MRMYDIIAKKRDKLELSNEEIKFFVDGYVSGAIEDYQASALLMAIYLNKMNERETAALTMCMAGSGDMVDLSPIEGIKVDKHSTGGVGDKTTLVIVPIVAACGVKVAKMSGRGLGYTGGTIDKLEAIPGLETSLSRERFFEIVNEVGASIISQSGNLAPADKKLYALRDVTATVENLSLICASIMSKKIAAGSDCILLDVKTGSGAFMKTYDEAYALAKAMVSVGESVKKHTIAIITNMDIPLGNAIGNSLEVIEAADTLKGHGPKDLTEVCLSLAANMLYLAKKGSIEECRNMAGAAVNDGTAFKCFKLMVNAQGGDTSVLDNTDLFEKAKFTYDIAAVKSGYITAMNTEQCGIASMLLGAGREKKDSKIDNSAGIMLYAKCGARVEKGDILAKLYSGDENTFQNAQKIIIGAITISQEPPTEYKAILGIVKND